MVSTIYRKLLFFFLFSQPGLERASQRVEHDFQLKLMKNYYCSISFSTNLQSDEDSEILQYETTSVLVFRVNNQNYSGI